MRGGRIDGEMCDVPEPVLRGQLLSAEPKSQFTTVLVVRGVVHRRVARARTWHACYLTRVFASSHRPAGLSQSSDVLRSFATVDGHEKCALNWSFLGAMRGEIRPCRFMLLSSTGCSTTDK